MRPERLAPLLLRGPHPELDLRRLAVRVHVEAVELAPARVRPRRQHLDLHRWQPHRIAQCPDHLAARLLGRRPVLRPKRGLERLAARMAIGRPLQADLYDRVALPVDRLLAPGQTRVVGEGHCDYLPVKRGLRFSRNAFAPSTRSSVVRRSVARSFSRRSPSASGSSRPLTTASLA